MITERMQQLAGVEVNEASRKVGNAEFEKAFEQLRKYIVTNYVTTGGHDKTFDAYFETGNKFYRIYTYNLDAMHNRTPSKEKRHVTIWGFVDRENGDIYKPAGLKAPAKHVRGNIFDKKTWTGFSWTGPQYLR